MLPRTLPRLAGALPRLAGVARRLGHAALTAAVLALPALAQPAEAGFVHRIQTGDQATALFRFGGEIVAGDLARLQAETAKVPPGQRIVLMLDSVGGSVDEGLALGRFIHRAKITTMAIAGPGCASACTYLFLAGRDHATGAPARIMVKGARIGFHQASIANLPKDRSFTADDVHAATRLGQEAVKRVNEFFNEIGLSSEFLALFLSAPSTGLTFLNEFDALRLGIYVMDPTTGRLVSPADFPGANPR